MLLAIERDKAKAVLDRYFVALENTGYVKQPTVMRFLAWLFLLDFVELVYTHLTDADYNLINKALICLFSTGNCLLPYGALTREDLSNLYIADSSYMGTFNIRVTEDRQWRSVEDETDFRITEG